MFSKRELEGYLRVDHRESPGLDMPLVGRNTLFEAPTFSCPYCQRIVVINPKRNRERAYCRSLDRLICDFCATDRASGKTLKPFKQVIDEFVTSTAKGLPYGT